MLNPVLIEEINRAKKVQERLQQDPSLRARLAAGEPIPAKQPKNKILGLPAPVVFILGAGVVVLGVMYVINRK